VRAGNPGEIQDRAWLVPLEDRRGEHPPLFAEPGGFLQPGVVAQLTPVQHRHARRDGHIRALSAPATPAAPAA